LGFALLGCSTIANGSIVAGREQQQSGNPNGKMEFLAVTEVDSETDIIE
jgi:hypothetical protein